MDPALPSLVFGVPWQGPRTCLVRSVDAVRLCHEGTYDVLSSRQSLSCLPDAVPSLAAEARDFVAKARLVSLSLRDWDDALLVGQLRKLIESGALVVVRESHGADSNAPSSLVKQRRVLRALEQAKLQVLKIEGRTYRLIAGADLNGMSDRDAYEVVGHDEAKRVLDGLAKGAMPEQARALVDAQSMISRDWRPPLSPDGLVLLRRILVVAAVPTKAGPLAHPQTAAGRESAQEDPADEEGPHPCAVQLAQASDTGSPFCGDCPV